MAFSIDASDPLTVFGALAVLIFLGFAGNLIFSKLRFNDTLILILIGVIVGPVMGLIEPDALLALSSIIGPLALILILFDGGLALKFRELASGLGTAVVLGIISFIATTVLLGGLTAVMLDIPFLRGAVLGAILGGTSALVVLPSLEHMEVAKKTGTVLGLESALTDVLVVVVSFTLISIAAAGVGPSEVLDATDVDGNGLFDGWEEEHFGGLGNNASADPDGDGRSNLQEMQQGSDPTDDDEAMSESGGFDAQGITSKLLITFSMSIFLGLAAGFAWLLIYPNLREKPYGYMLTLGFMFAMYVFVEWILQDVSQGGGPLAVLAFGIILGNNQSLGAMGRRVGDDFGATMKRFQGEISFLVRTFFFIFLGIIVDLELLKDIRILGISLLLMGGMLVARYIAVAATSRRIRPRGDDWVMIVMMPRGLAAAVLAAVPASMALPHLDHEGIPGTESFVALAFLLLVGTNLLATVGALYLEKNPPAPVPMRTASRSSKSASKTTRSKSPSKTKAKSTSKSAKARSSKTAKGTRSTTQSALEDLGRKG